MIQETVYNAYTKIGTIEKKEVLDFLYRHVENCHTTKDDVLRVVEYAIKDRASFGGFVLALKDDGKIVGIAVVNQTGMEGNSPKNVLVQIARDKNYTSSNLLQRLIDLVLIKTGGNVGLQISANNPAIHHFEKLGFQTGFIMMELQRLQVRPDKVLRQYRNSSSNR